MGNAAIACTWTKISKGIYLTGCGLIASVSGDTYGIRIDNYRFEFAQFGDAGIAADDPCHVRWAHCPFCGGEIEFEEVEAK